MGCNGEDSLGKIAVLNFPEERVMLPKSPSFILFLVLAVVIATPQPGWAQAGAEFEPWLAELKREAIGRGISAAIVEEAFVGVQPIPRIIKLDRKQPEFTQTLAQYLDARVSKQRIKQGRQKYAENRELLQKIEARFGVQGRFIVAFWGMETNYGRYTGGFNVIAALTTLAFDGRRSAFFRKQLLDALTILDEGHISVDRMKGSWAGAMGQTQFMPSTFRAYAVDGDGDGKIDIWGSKADAFASAGHYLSSVGWRGDQTWGREVVLPEGFDPALIDRKVEKTLPEWQALGVRRLFGNDLPQRNIKAFLVQPDGPEGRAFLAYPANYRAILNWNRSHKFAIAVGTLADAIVR